MLTLTPFLYKTESFEKTTKTVYGAGFTPWERPDIYVDASPVMKAHKVITPLLIIHNPNDSNIAWRQGIEFSMALRRLGKPSWMLQYDDSGHANYGKDAWDYTVRVKQFFDHYLMEKPAPIWMTKGIPAKLKQVETGYELDPAGKCSTTCPVCNKKDLTNKP